MKLTKKQKQELWNCHDGVGFVVVKVNENTIKTAEFYTDRNGDIRYITDYGASPIFELKEFVKE